MAPKQPLGIELARRNLISEKDIDRALEYQKNHPGKKLGDILYMLNLCDSEKLIEVIGEILDENVIILTESNIKTEPKNFVSIDIMKRNKAIPFEEESGKVKVCFADTSNKKSVDTIRLLLLNKGLTMEKYVTFESNIEKILINLEGLAGETIDPNNGDITALVDSIIKIGMEKRASDIHFEPMNDKLRVRYRIDGELINAMAIKRRPADYGGQFAISY